MSKESLFPPPLAGLCTHAEGAGLGLAVEETVVRLRRYVYLKSQLVFLFARHFNGLPEWEVKGAISLHLWQDAEHSTWLRGRITEMRTPPHHLDKVPEPALGHLVDAIDLSADSVEFLVAVYGVLKPAMRDALREHLARTHPIADHPTRRLLQRILVEEDEQHLWGQAAIEATLKRAGLTRDAEKIVAWRQTLESRLRAAGGVDGQGVRDATESLPIPVPRADRTTRIPRRDERFAQVWQSRGVVPASTRPVHERLWWMMNVRLNEMHVSELVATVIADWTGQPWEFYHDLARHLWDETRHCLLGEIAFVSQGVDFTQIPTHVGFAEYPNTQLSPADRYAFLWGIEQGLMTKTGKQAEVALAREGGDERATLFQDYDWADEVLHAAIGRRWLEPHFGSREAMHDAYARVRPAYDQLKEADLAKPGRDWWPAFYAQFLRQRDPHPSQSAALTSAPADDSY
ncbi:MAG: hypothetical protein U1F61_17675 [Opitutaceae bacterium]